MGTAAVFIESYLFPVLFLYFIYGQLQFFHLHGAELGSAVEQLFHGHLGLSGEKLLTGAIVYFFMILLDVTIIYGLIVRRNLKRKPRGVQEIVIPLLGTFFYLAFNFVEYMPKQLNILVFPEKYLGISTMIGLILNIIGAAISSIATYHLRFSYGIFVQLRDIMTKGLYRFVRHPIYLGYTLSTLGFLFDLPSLGCMIVFLLSLSITIYRAKLEERELLTSKEYQEYARKTPFLFPRLLK